MFAVWEYEEDINKFISYLNVLKDVVALTLAGRLIPQKAPPYRERPESCGTIRQSEFVFFVSNFMISAEWYEQVLQYSGVAFF